MKTPLHQYKRKENGPFRSETTDEKVNEAPLNKSMALIFKNAGLVFPDTCSRAPLFRKQESSTRDTAIRKKALEGPSGNDFIVLQSNALSLLLGAATVQRWTKPITAMFPAIGR